MTTWDKDIKDSIKNQVQYYLNTLKPKAQYRRCFSCHEPFKLTNRNRYYCDSKCSRKAHYLRFRIGGN